MSATKQILVHGIEHPNASEAIQHLDCSHHDHAISIGSRFFSVTAAELGRIQRLGFQPTTYHDYRGPNNDREQGKLVTVPGRDG